MIPDYERAAIKATETLIKHNIGTAPIDPLPILKKTPGVLVLSFEEMSKKANIDRREIISMIGCENQDAVTTVYLDGENVRYVVAYNRLLSSRIIDRALARELGHILLGHDGTRPESVRQEEAKCFAHHLLCPRPLIHSIQASGLRLTMEVFGNITGFGEHCLSCMRKQPPVHVSAELNRAVREQFSTYISEFLDFQSFLSAEDDSMIANFGTYLDGYEE